MSEQKHLHEEDTCGCGHDHAHEHEHEDDCGCGHDHAHEHEHEDDCGCGHDHGHAHDHAHVPGHPDDCDCEICHPHEDYCDVCGQSLSNCTCTMPDENCVKKVYILENLGCANCAAKMEKKIKELPGVTYATITYTTKQLRLSASDPDALLPQIQAICTAIESEVKVVPRTKSPGSQITRTYTVENLGCANCAAKMEKRISELDGITNATLTFATKQLRVTGKNPDALFEEMQKICSTIESEVKLVPRDTRPKSRDTLNVNEILPEARQITPVVRLSDNAKTLLGIGAGAVLFIAGEILEHQVMDTASLLVLLIGYVILGGRIVLTAVKNLLKGQIFDENFLMSIATLGAFAIREYPEAVGVMLFYRIGEYFEHIAVEKSRGQIMDTVDMRPEVVNLVVGDDVRVIDAEEANVGDILLIRPGDRIPLDGVIVEGESRLDTSPVTGEPVPVAVGYGDEVTSGCVNTSGLLKIRVEKILEESMVTRILDSVENAAASKPQIDRFITRFARIYTPVVVLLAAATAIIPSLITGNWYYYIYTALTFLVMSCPCALVLSVPLAFFSGIGTGSKRGILFKGGIALEAMKNVDAVIMDKTGTITKGNFVVQRAVPAAEGISQEQLLSFCASCELSSTHPIGASILSAANEQKLSIARPVEVEEIAGHGIRAVLPDTNAAVNAPAGQEQKNSAGSSTILCGNRKLMKKFGVSLENYHKNGFGTEVLVAKDGVFIGHLVISDTIKEDAKSAISQIKKLGIETVMLTGDAEDSAQAVADATGIDEVHAKLLPQDKLTELIQVRNAHGSVMFVGDGINDAPVLAGADVGAAMGSGADAAIEAADVVFMTSSMEAIPQSLAIARATNKIAWQNVVFALVIKVLVMILGLCGFASMWMAVFADTGVAMLCVLNSIRVLYRKNI
ncbi:MAG: heavy metal translocating P-type ATPase [Lachnospiraceae bacterium]|nr:heavy metal translocating P-type ATPase [Lachnospiraceae bacterium]